MRISRSKVELFLDCKRCFYLDMIKGVRRPGGMVFNLNLAVDSLLKKEFDIYREKQVVPPMLFENGLEMIPYKNEKMEVWRSNFKGISHKIGRHEYFGAVDDIWINKNQELVVVDYKATAKSNFRGLESSMWKEQYKRQLSFYAWLLKCNGYKVGNTGYFVYCNAKTNKDSFDSRLDFDISLNSYILDYSWIDAVISEVSRCLEGSLPAREKSCEYCEFAFASNENLGFDF